MYVDIFIQKKYIDIYHTSFQHDLNIYRYYRLTAVDPHSRRTKLVVPRNTRRTYLPITTLGCQYSNL